MQINWYIGGFAQTPAIFDSHLETSPRRYIFRYIGIM